MIPETLTAGISLLTPLALCLTSLGVLFGLIVGALPGLGPLMGIILMLPLAITMPPVAAMGFLIAIFVGGSCGGSISAVMVGIPGTPLSAATLIDGFPMAKKGRAADAIGIAISASALGGLFGGVVLVLFSPLLANVASSFAPPEYTALAVTGLLAIVVVSEGSLMKGLISGAAGLLLATIGTDSFTTGYRFTFGLHDLLDGFHLVPIVVGLFAIPEMLEQVRRGNLTTRPKIEAVRPSFRSIGQTMKHWGNILRSSSIGAFLGTLPGAGGVISSFTAYAIAKSVASKEEGYGEGAEGGLVATESANNATVGGTLVPSFALGVPGDASSAVLIGAMLILGFFPGPRLFAESPEVVSGMFLAYLFSNVALLAIGILATPLFARILKLKKAYLIPAILLLCVMGTFALQASLFDVWAMIGFGVLGIVMRAGGYPVAPLVIAVILGPLLEANLRRSLLLSREGFWIFFERPISASLIMLDLLLLIAALTLTILRVRRSHAADAPAKTPR